MIRADVQSTVEARLIVERGEVVRMEMALRYFAADPLAVRALFVAEGGSTVEWHFARDLLREGRTRRVDDCMGEGDVRVWSAWSDDRPVVVLSLTSPDGSAALEIDMEEVRTFLDATEMLVPYDTEAVDVDSLLGRIFAVTS